MTATASRDLDTPAPPDPPSRWPARARSWSTRMLGGRRGTVLAVLLVALGVALPLPTLFHYQGPPMEEGFMLVFPERVLAGDVPNRDFLHLYGPGSLWGLAAWYRIAGTTLAAERVYGLVQHLGIIFGLFTLALPWGRRIATSVGLLGVLLVITPIGLTALAWNGAVALAVVGTILVLHGSAALAQTVGGEGRPRRAPPEQSRSHGVAARVRNLFATRPAGRADPLDRSPSRNAAPVRARAWLGAGGLFFGLALLWRPDLALATGLALVALGWRQWRRELIGPVVVGVLVGVSPILVHLSMAGLGPSFEGMFLQPVFELRGGRHLPIPPSWDRLDGALAAVAQLRVPDWPLPMLAPSQQVFLWFLALPLAALTVLGTGIVAVRRTPGSTRSRTLLVVGALGVGLLPQALQRPDTTHLAWVSCVPLVFLPVALAQCGEWWRARRGRGSRAPAWVVPTAAALVPLLAVALVLPAYTSRTWLDLTRQNLTGEYFGWAVRRGDRTFYLGSPEIAARAQAVTDALSARIEPGDRLFVGTADLRKTPYSDAFFYFLFPEATPATRYIEMDPGIANAEDSGLAEDVASADWLILSHVWDSWDEPNDSRLFGSNAPNEVVDDQFCLVGPPDDYYELYGRCD